MCFMYWMNADSNGRYRHGIDRQPAPNSRLEQASHCEAPLFAVPLFKNFIVRPHSPQKSRPLKIFRKDSPLRPRPLTALAATAAFAARNKSSEIIRGK